MNNGKWILALLSVIIFIATAYSCPLCSTTTGQQVREGIFNHDFLLNLFALISPFIIFTLIALILSHGLPLRRRQVEKDEQQGAQHD